MAQHAWPGPAHHHPYLFAALGTVAMHQALVTGRLGIPERTLLQPPLGVIAQTLARRT